MSKAKRSLVTTLIYLTVSLGVLLWSGTARPVSLFDRYLVTLDRIALPTSDRALAESFYRESLDFRQTGGHIQSIRNPLMNHGDFSEDFLLPDGKLLGFSPDAPVLVFRVRNGFYKLHKALVKNISAFTANTSTLMETQKALPEQRIPEQRIPEIRISEISPGAYGPQFLVHDPSGNILLFYRTQSKLPSITERAQS